MDNKNPEKNEEKKSLFLQKMDAKFEAALTLGHVTKEGDFTCCGGRFWVSHKKGCKNFGIW